MKISKTSISFASILFLVELLASIHANAQIVPDSSLPVNSVVTPSGNTNIIEGGTTSGSNLFHSFGEFSVPTGSTVLFNNAADVQNIFTRVTGQTISNIDGLIKANGVANLFLLNPNGIIFGPNAQLNIGGSFLATTATSFKFADGTEFAANNPQSSSLLTVNVPIGLQFGATPGDIVNKSVAQTLLPSPFDPTQTPIPTTVGLAVLPGKELALLGGKVIVDGGYITASSGQVELGSVAGNNLVKLNFNSSIPGFGFGYEGVANFDDIQLINLASVDTSGIGGGQIQVQGRNVTLLSGAKISSNTVGDTAGRDINITASDAVQVLGTTATPGLYELSQLAFGILVPLRSAISTTTSGGGNAGNVVINSRQLNVRDGAQISASAFIAPGRTDVGNVAGKGGNITLNVSDLVEVSGVVTVSGVGRNPVDFPGRERQFAEVNGASNIITSSGGFGNAGDLTINTNRLIVSDGATIVANPFAVGRGGQLTVNASDSVLVTGTSPNGVLTSSIATTATAVGDAGDITINTARLIIDDGGNLAVQTLSIGKGGNLTVNASDSVELSGAPNRYQKYPSSLVAGSESSGEAGNLTIATREFIVRDESVVSVRSGSTGDAGDVNITADNIRLDNGTLTGATNAGEKGNITLRSNSLQLRRGSTITTNSTGNATGGNITLTTDTIAALENSDITANAVQSFGGRVTIDTSGIFGTQFRSQQTDASDITASSELGSQFSGVVEINTPDVDPSSGLVELSANYVDVSDRIASACPAEGGNAFVVTGRGGIPSDPTQTLRASTVWRDVRSISSNETRRTSLAPQTNYQQPIAEATSWTIDRQGRVELIANDKPAQVSNPWNKTPNCGG